MAKKKAAAPRAPRVDLVAELNSAIDSLDHVVQWMEDTALPQLGDDCDGGNMLCEGLRMNAEELKDAVAAAERLEAERADLLAACKAAATGIEIATGIGAAKSEGLVVIKILCAAIAKAEGGDA